jgi:putative membrane protein
MMWMIGLGMLLFWVLILGGGVWLVQTLAHSSGSGSILSQDELPLDILKKRYSRGEITKEEFQEMKRDLGL